MLTDADILVAAANVLNGAGLIGADTITEARAGRLVGNRTLPYAQLESKATKKIRYLEGVGGAPYVTFHRLTFTLYGIGMVAVSGLLKQVATAFDAQGMVIVNPVTGNPDPNANLVHCLPEDDSGQLVPDPDVKTGEDIWKGVLAWSVAFSAVD